MRNPASSGNPRTDCRLLADVGRASLREHA